MKYIVKFIKLPLQLKLIYIEAFFILGLTRFLIWKFKFKRIAGFIGKVNNETELTDTKMDLKKVKLISYAVRTMSKYTLWKSNCLTQAFTAKIMLDRRKLKSTVYLGVAKDGDNQMIAHAWLRCGKIYVTGGDGSKYYTVTGKFS